MALPVTSMTVAAYIIFIEIIAVGHRFL